MNKAPTSPVSLRRLAAVILISLTASASAYAAGVKTIEVPADTRGPKIDALLWSPCATPPGEVSLFDGRVTIPGVKDCPVLGHKLPAIIISHGLGGEFLGHHDVAEALADGRFAVVALNHPLDSAFDMKRANEVSALVERPIDVQRLIDYLQQASPIAHEIDLNRIGFFGFSRGGYTGLVLAGAVPELPQRAGGSGGRDQRITAFVIVDPLTQNFFPTRESLREVAAPIQVWSSEKGGQGVTREKVANLVEYLPVKAELHLVPNSSHLSFIAPCTPDEAKIAGEACIDPPGFDRVVFHKKFDADILAFFRKRLAN